MNSATSQKQKLSAPAPVVAPTKRRPLRWFIASPARMALDPGLSHVAFRLATVLLHYEGEQGCFPSQQRLADHLATSLDSVQRYLRELELYGFLVRERRYRKTNRYTLAPVYEAPIAHGSLEATGSLEVENDETRRPPSPRTLRRPKEKPPTSAARAIPPPASLDNARRIRENIPAESFSEEDAALVRPFNASESPVYAAPVRSLQKTNDLDTIAARVRSSIAASVRREEPHECGTIKNVPIQDSQQQEADTTTIGGAEINLKEGLLALRLVGIALTEKEVGVNIPSDVSLQNQELIDWANWVVSSSNDGIRNKPAFCAAKIRLGFALIDVFPSSAIKRQADVRRAEQAENADRDKQLHNETSERADLAIAAMTPEERIALREHALNDGAVWLARDLSPELHARIILATERKIALAIKASAIPSRDHRIYKTLPPL